ncbi:exonuclease [Nostoc minutum NIES-26]|uniref:Exonuclease n=1 Tax=Nostoc minutum NIES-26 TaxID=1844469 RepID=A0A367RSV7_9NOSO|nr:exonuclease [Nostoc minutum NIES-26]
MNATLISWCLSGEVEQGYLNTDFGAKIKIRDREVEGTGVWKCVPVTTSTGELVSIAHLEKLEKPQPSICVGRVIQVSKRGTVLVKFSASSRITFYTSLQLALNGIYQLEFTYREQTLHITSAVRVDELQSKPQTVSPAQIPEQQPAAKSKLSLEQSWRQKLEALIIAQFPQIRLSDFTHHQGTLEWSGTVENKKLRIQGTVGNTALAIHEFCRSYNSAQHNSHPDRLRVTPLGAARGIGASCFKVEIGNYEVVLDAGTRPKGSNPLPAFEHLNNPNLILIGHAHQDHIGALPVLHRMFPATPMICTPGTRTIAQVMLSDCLLLQQLNEDFEPLFDETDLQETLFRLETQVRGREFQPLPGLTVKFINAGHIVGAACIYLKLGNRSLLYTGDYNLANSRTTEGLQINDLPTADILITEATYGASVHPNRKQQETELVQAVWDVVAKGGNVLIPAFALGRAQEIILALKTSVKFSRSQVPIYVDGLVRAVTDVFSDNLSLLPKTVQNLALASRTAPFCDGKRVIAISDPQQRPIALSKPSVIIASSGMLSGGASVYYAKVLLERENAAIFISGYTDEESPGRLLQNMQQGEVVTIDEQDYTVRALLRKFNLSAHTDRVGIGQVIAKVAPHHLVLVHGTSAGLHDLARSDLQKHYIIHIPRVGDVVEYGVVPEFISESTQIELTYPKEIELEIVAEHDGAWIRVPPDVVDVDPRWQLLSQMGSVRAKWNGSTLVLLPISLQSVALSKAKGSLNDCCAKCQFLDNGMCQSADSVLYQRIVDPMGVCPEFVKQ